ncbi:DUF1572 domain-containing protein [Winogradskyella haliclonae]|uniref:DUF1572 domain-containing protein n=1 Tax=Winogradskyella haliclonae TaxID=2048558 RepID=A0ABQ2C1M9_9FLAO|nr:DUF1572 domain-containing protein [Winogradskyella haliclonae]GGI58096.1 hypothetical protein GCM10011444_24050 [Winogradskyella haliclonae]
MSHIQHVSKHLNDVFFGGNWTASNVKDTITPITLKEAHHKIKDCNTIAVLVFHINYYVEGILPIFKGGGLEIRDKYSFDAPEFKTEQDWEGYKTKVLKNAQLLVDKVNKLSDVIIFEPFVDEKYGNYYRNLNGLIEHTHYHLGQIAILKKLTSKS